MPRARRVRRLFPIALTMTELAYALGIPHRAVRDAVKQGQLECWQVGVRKLIFVQSAVDWIRATRKRVHMTEKSP